MNQPKYTIKQILKDNIVKFLITFIFSKQYLFRKNILETLLKIINCKDGLGYSKFICPNHPDQNYLVPHTCKSRSCTTCGVKATNNWAFWINKSFPNKPAFHIIYTIPDDLHKFFFNNRKYLKFLLKAAAESMISWFKDKNYGIPAITCVLHTSGSKLNWHPHVHMIISAGCLNIESNYWKSLSSIPQSVIHKRFKAILLKYIGIYLNINPQEIHRIYQKRWYCFIKCIDDTKITVNYIGRYIKHPPIGQSRIIAYNRKLVSFIYKDYRNDENSKLTCSVSDFICLFVSHIPLKHKKMVMHYGLMANRVFSKYQSILKKLGLLPFKDNELYLCWRKSVFKFFGKDPLVCPVCKSCFVFSEFVEAVNYFFHPVFANCFHVVS